MDLRFTAEERAFRAEARSYLDELLRDEFAEIRGRGGPGDEHSFFEERLAWERRLGVDGWTCVGWPTEHGGRGLPIDLQVIWYEEYARAGAPGRVGHIGEGLLGPTLIHFGSASQQQRFLPKIRLGEELWCQGYSEPNAGSDLANVQTRAESSGSEWLINGQKVWTSLAQWSDWCFLLARTNREAPKHKGISFLLVRMDAEGIEVVPIVQLTGTTEFNEVFFSDVRTDESLVVGGVDNGWRVAMGLLSFERGASTLAQQFAFSNEFAELVDAAKTSGRDRDPVWRQRLASLHGRLEIMRWNTLRMLTKAGQPELSDEAYIGKLFWANLHKDLAEAHQDLLGAAGLVCDAPPYELSAAQRLFMFTRSDTIYGGSNEIQRNIIGERALGLAPEPRNPVGRQD